MSKSSENTIILKVLSNIIKEHSNFKFNNREKDLLYLAVKASLDAFKEFQKEQKEAITNFK